MKFFRKYWSGILLIFIFMLALTIRCLPWKDVYANGEFRINGVDGYYHMRLVDHMVRNFPHRLYFDIYTIFPTGSQSSWPPLFTFIIAGVALLVGLGNPSDFIVNMSGMIVPAVIGAALVFPAYFITKRFMGKFAGISAAAIMATIPGETLGRTLFGAPDHHGLEALLMGLVALFIFMSEDAKLWNWRTIICGVLVGLYVLTWNGGLLIIFLLAVYMCIRSIIYRKSVLNFSIIFLLPFIMSILWLAKESETPMIFIFLAGLAILSIILDSLNRLVPDKWFTTLLLSCGGLAIVVVYMIDKNMVFYILGQLSYIFGWSRGTSLFEMQPILYPGQGNTLSFDIIWGNLTFSLVISIILLIILAVLIIKKKVPIYTVFLFVWSIMMFLAMLAQRRFAYYYSMNAAILSGIAIGWIYNKLVKVFDKYKYGNKRYIFISVFTVIPLLFTIGPNIEPDLEIATNVAFLPSDAWMSSLMWLRDNTPEPLPIADYYTTYDEKTWVYPNTAYGVMSWWDYGHWITRIAKRIPCASPSSTGSSPTFFSNTKDDIIMKMTKDMGIKYVVIDYTMATSKFYAIIALASPRNAGYIDPSSFSDRYFMSNDLITKLSQSVNVDVETIYRALMCIGRYSNGALFEFYHEDYYNSPIARLYNFDCQNIATKESWVVQYTKQYSSSGVEYKYITDLYRFGNYQEAKDFEQQDKNNRRIVGFNPFVNPIDIKAIPGFKEVYASPEMKGNQPEIKIFEVVGK